MFEAAELGHKLDKRSFDRELPALREALLKAQSELRESKRFPVLVLVNGVDGAGKGETVNELQSWLDPRVVRTHAFGEPSPEERERPDLWRFWQALPPKGKTGLFMGNWYTAPIVDRVFGRSKKSELQQSISTIEHFERMLIDEGTLLLKFWFHLSKTKQRERLKSLERDKRTRWRVTETDWEHARHYDDFRAVSETVLRETSSGPAPWYLVDGTDHHYRSMLLGKTLLEQLRKRLDAPAGTHARTGPRAAPTAPVDKKRNVLQAVDLTQKLDKAPYERALEEQQGRLNLLCRDKRFAKRSLILVYEGWDAAGKGGNIRRVTGALDARHYAVVPIAAPTEEERAQPYLWRFWRHMPRRGHVRIFDRSWYGRVLVERVEGFCEEQDWQRAYAEMNDFEEQLVQHGAVVVKLWLHLSKAEQLKRFNERSETEFKRYKITDEDWRNREKWDAYETAVCDMIDRTSTELAPWHLVPANDKHFARIFTLRAINDQLERALGSKR